MVRTPQALLHNKKLQNLKNFTKEINLENFTFLKLISSTALHFKRQLQKLKEILQRN
jgi:hypothetical protein